MLSTQTIEKSMLRLTSITGKTLFVYTPDGRLLVKTGEDRVPSALTAKKITAFVGKNADSGTVTGAAFHKVMEDGETAYIAAAAAEKENAVMLAAIAAQNLTDLLEAQREKLTHNSFFQGLLLDNILRVDIYSQARRLRIDQDRPRGVVVFELENNAEQVTATQVLGALFHPQNGDYLTALDENSVILIKELHDKDAYKELKNAAKTGVDMLETEAMLNARAGYGTIIRELRNLSNSHKEAKMALEVGRIFYAGRQVISYEKLGIGRLVYQLPVSLCTMFMKEVFGTNHMPLDLDAETLATIDAFFENNLNLSETARQLFIHRNTLVYRIERISRLCGLDIRSFDDAVTFRIALMVAKYLEYMEQREM